MKYTVHHKTTYGYSAPVHQSYHLLHLSPREVPHQKVLRHRITTLPGSDLRHDLHDYFGNPYTILTIEEDHTELVVDATSEVEVASTPPHDLAATTDWQLLANNRTGANSAMPKDVIQYVVASRNGPRLQTMADYAAPSFPDGQPVLAGAHELMRRMFEDFAFDAAATDVSTPVETVLEHKRGVCQDFAHVMIAALRSLNLPARYVSGYIRTIPPEGQQRLQGADASHAWVSVWAPETGWVDFDPTNNVTPHGDHITIAYGRDYDDVSPISGVLLGGGGHSVDVAVDVVPLNQDFNR